MLVKPLGDSAIQVRFEEPPTPYLNNRIRAFAHYLEQHSLEGIIEWVPAYQTITIHYNPLILDYSKLHHYLVSIKVNEQTADQKSEVIYIPTCYDGEDLDVIAEHNGLSIRKVIQLHSEKPYLVYMLGFLPGFPYLGGLNSKIRTPRRNTPRPSVPKGAVGIGGEQTGIYPITSPGGWNIIGRTPIPFFNPNNENPFLIKAGDYIQFVPISNEEYSQITKEINNRDYKIKRGVIVHEN